jgi:hypothetical protein
VEKLPIATDNRSVNPLGPTTTGADTFAMSYLIFAMLFLSLMTGACAATIRGRVVDRSNHGVAGASVKAFHYVATIEIYDPRNPPWKGNLGETCTDGNGYFTLRTTDRGSLDAIVASRGNFIGGIHPPFANDFRIVLRPKRLPAHRRGSK